MGRENEGLKHRMVEQTGLAEAVNAVRKEEGTMGQQATAGFQAQIGQATTNIQQLTTEVDAQRDANDNHEMARECTNCMDRPRNTSFSSCLHFALCHVCAASMDACPQCGVPITGRRQHIMV